MPVGVPVPVGLIVWLAVSVAELLHDDDIVDVTVSEEDGVAERVTLPVAVIVPVLVETGDTVLLGVGKFD